MLLQCCLAVLLSTLSVVNFYVKTSYFHVGVFCPFLLFGAFKSLRGMRFMDVLHYCQYWY